MVLRIQEMGVDILPQYKEIPIAFEVKSLFRVDLINAGLGGIKLREEEVEPPYIKDYDAYEDGGPQRWLKRFDVRNWGFFLALDQTRPLGGAVVAFNTPDVHMLAGRTDLAVLWDLRVHPDFRRCGIGTKLFDHATDWSRKRGCKQLKIETQNVNVPACRFYAKQGCQLGEINRYWYAPHPEVGHEVMLVWYLDF
jgi:GNAT superfamily N-acetyltransferase